MKKITGLILLSLLLAKADAQVNLQTGSAVFSLPMFQWQDNKSRLTSIVALNYNSGNGLKVNEVASNVGQGWSLVAGGVITRMQVGEPDDQKAYYQGMDIGQPEKDNDITKYPAGFLYATVPAYKGCPDALTKYPLYKAKNILYRQHNIIAEDRQLDYFSFQFNGKAGIFVLDPNDSIGWSLGDTKMKITFHTDTSIIHNDAISPRTTITSFTIQDVDGLIYKFTIHGMSKVLEQNFCDKDTIAKQHQPKFENGHAYYQAGFVNTKYKNPWIINSWFLSEIEDPLTNRKITFSYDTRNVKALAGANISYTYVDAKKDKSYVTITYKISVAKTPAISAITYPDGHTVAFNYDLTKPRADLPGEYPLASVDIKYQGRYLSEYQLDTKYFILTRYGTPVTDYEKSVARLCLLSVRKIGVDRKEDSPPYRFDYYKGSDNPDDFVPPPFFYAHDIWGYYNGNASKAYDGSAIPLNRHVEDLSFKQLKGLCFIRNGLTTPVLNPKAGYAKNGLLKQIIYPTGGTLMYQYSQNMGKLPGGSGDVQIGGVHVSQTSSTDGGYTYGCSNPLITHYNYTLTNGASSLWGLEKPINFTKTHTHYEPEAKKFHITWSGPECYWRYQYPGIQSQYQSVKLTWWQSAAAALGPVLGIVGTATTAMDLINLIIFSTGWTIIIIDAIGILANFAISCFSDNTHRFDHTVYYNMDLNSISPLPQQFKRVEIVQESGDAGKTVETFTSDNDYPLWVPAGQNTIFSAKQRFAPWAYGLPKLMDVYDTNGHLIRETENIYSFNHAKSLIKEGSPKYFCFDNPDVCEATGLHTFLISCNYKVLKTNSQRSTDWSKSGNGGYDDPESYYNLAHLPSDGQIEFDFYGMYTGRVELETTYEKAYRVNNPAQYVQTETDYFYNSGSFYDSNGFRNSNYEVNKIITYQSNGDINYKYIKYSSDYTGGILSTLVQNNIVSLPVETHTSVAKADGTGGYLSEQVTEFTQLANGDVRPFRILEQRFSKPESGMATYSGPGSDVSRYKITQIFTYDNDGNLIGSQDEGMHSISNIYGYNDKYVIAKVMNANPLTDKPAYTSFETDDELVKPGGWTLNGSASYITTSAITGKRSLALSSGKSLTASLNTAKSYTLSFWATSSNVSVSGGATRIKSAPSYNGFTYYEYTIPKGASSISVTGSADIDELRLYPQTARMLTTTYDPLIGKTSECDENNRITYYTYDNLGRLQFVKDEKKNVVKMYEYNNVSAAKQRGCPSTYYNHKISEVFTRNNCTSNTVPDTNLYIYTVPANKYSSTISQADADAKAQTELLTNGQAQANTNSACIAVFYNHEVRITDTSQSCDAGYKGGAVTYTVPAGRYSSVISQADADAKAQEEAEANIWAYVNDPAHRACIYTSDPEWEELEADTSQEYCNPSGHLMVYMTDLNPHSSTYNQKQWFDVGAQNKCPACVPSFTYSGQIPSYQMNNIDLSGTEVHFVWVFSYPAGGVTYFKLGTISGSCGFPTSTRTIPYLFGSTTYHLIINPDGSVYVQITSGPPPTGTIGFTGYYDLNKNAFYSAQESGIFTKNDCPAGQMGSKVTYTVPPYRYQSYISQADADQKAIDEVNANGQNYANAHGTCSVPCTFTPTNGISFYTSTVSESGNTASFDFVFQAPYNNYGTGNLGTIGGGCVPSTTQYLIVTDGATSSRKWSVTIYSSGLVNIHLYSGQAPGTSGPPVVLQGTYNL